MICNNCSAQYPDEANFCPYCGAPKQPVYDNNQPDYQNNPYNYQQPYNQPYNAPYGYNKPAENPDDKPSFILKLAAFLVPIVGIILYFIWKDEFPKKAKSVGKWALISFVLSFVFYGIIFALSFIFAFTAEMSAFSYMTNI